MQKRRHFLNTHIAGLTYYDAVLVFKNLEIGFQLDLEIDENNKFDPYAVAIYANGYKIGYVPKTSNKELYKFLEMGYSDAFDVRINKINPNEHPESQIGISIHLLPAK